jgi:ferrochelatase
MKQAVLLVSHGTVDDLDDLEAFVTNIRRGRAPGAELVAELRRRYQAIGGKSPLNAYSAKLAEKLGARLGVPVAWSNRLWKPYVRDVLEGLAAAGARRIVLLPLAQHSTTIYEADARPIAEGLGLGLVSTRDWGNRPDLCAAFAGRIASALTSLPDPSCATVLITAHSLPSAVIARGDRYETEFRAAAETVAQMVRALGIRAVPHAVAFQSQGMGGAGADGKPTEWLGPDVPTALSEIASGGDRAVVFAAIGFLADHVEVLYDLDVEARAMCAERGLAYVRAASLNADEDFVEVLADLARPMLAHAG